MSIIPKRRGENEYLYFQYYDDRERVMVYLGSLKDPKKIWQAWRAVRRKYIRAYRNQLLNRLEELDKTISLALKYRT